MEVGVEGDAKLVRKGDVLIVYGRSMAVLYAVYGFEDGWRFVELDLIDREDIAGTICGISLLLN